MLFGNLNAADYVAIFSVSGPKKFLRCAGMNAKEVMNFIKKLAKLFGLLATSRKKLKLLFTPKLANRKHKMKVFLSMLCFFSENKATQRTNHSDGLALHNSNQKIIEHP